MNDIDDLIVGTTGMQFPAESKRLEPYNINRFIKCIKQNSLENYCECVIDSAGRIYPVEISIENTISHLAALKRKQSYQEYLDTMPEEYYLNPCIYAMRFVKAIAVHPQTQLGIAKPTPAQLNTLAELKGYGLIHDHFAIRNTSSQTLEEHIKELGV